QPLGGGSLSREAGAGPHVRARARGGRAAARGPGARRVPGQRGGGGRRRGPESRASIPRRVRPAQDARSHRGPLAPRLSASGARGRVSRGPRHARAAGAPHRPLDGLLAPCPLARGCRRRAGRPPAIGGDRSEVRMARARRTAGWLGLSAALLGAIWGIYALLQRIADEGPEFAANRFLLTFLTIAIIVLALGL